MRLLQICLMLLVVHEARAQQSRPAGDPGKATAALTRTSFSTSGLHHEKTLTSLYLGDFVNINFDRENLPFLMRAGIEAPGITPPRENGEDGQ